MKLPNPKEPYFLHNNIINEPGGYSFECDILKMRDEDSSDDKSNDSANSSDTILVTNSHFGDGFFTHDDVRTAEELGFGKELDDFKKAETGIASLGARENLRSKKFEAMKNENDEEYLRVIHDKSVWSSEITKNPDSQEIIKILKYYDEIIGKYEEWYTANHMLLPDINSKRNRHEKATNEQMARMFLATWLKIHPDIPNIKTLNQQHTLTKNKWYYLFQEKNAFVTLLLSLITDKMSFEKLNQIEKDKLKDIKSELQNLSSNDSTLLDWMRDKYEQKIAGYTSLNKEDLDDESLTNMVGN